MTHPLDDKKILEGWVRFLPKFPFGIVDLLLLLSFPYEGGTLLTLSGFGFNENSKVLVGNETCNVIEGDLNKITCRTPKVRHLILVVFFFWKLMN